MRYQQCVARMRAIGSVLEPVTLFVQGNFFVVTWDTCKQGVSCLCRLTALCGSLLVFNLLYETIRVLAFQDRRSHVWCFYVKKYAMFVGNRSSGHALLHALPV